MCESISKDVECWSVFGTILMVEYNNSKEVETVLNINRCTNKETYFTERRKKQISTEQD